MGNFTKIIHHILRCSITALFFCCLPLRGQDVNLYLNGQWELSYWKQPQKAVCSPEEMSAVKYKTIPATVPGNVEIDLMKAGLIKDPRIGSNVYDLRPYEAYQWCYSRHFFAPPMHEGETCLLHFGGIDCFAEIWLNGKHVGSAHNMMIDYDFDITEQMRQGDNLLQVILRSSVIEGQKYMLGTLSIGAAEPESYFSKKAPEALFVRKACSGYGWDIMPRTVSAGLWRDVSLRILPPAHFTDIHWMTLDVDVPNRTGRFYAHFQADVPFDLLDHAKATFKLKRNGKTCFSRTEPLTQNVIAILDTCRNVDFWWPRGMGEAALYEAVIDLTDESGKLLCRDARRFGFRTIMLDRSEIHESKENPGRFRFYVNGEPVFIKGANWTPLDGLHSRDAELLDSTVALAVDLNCNMLRCWGGNVYEDHRFFDLCDENGIMVWQDFGMACASPSQRQLFIDLMEEEAISVVRKLRSHPSLALWSGNNENDQTYIFRWPPQYKLDPNDDYISRVLLKKVIYEFDPLRPYLPSSPYYTPAVFALGDWSKLPENHIWGPRGYYKEPFYKDAKCLVASEMGYHGCPNLSSLKLMMEPANVYPWEDRATHRWNRDWLTKATRRYEAWGYIPKRNDLMINQVNLLFGYIPDTLEDFVLGSQLVQAEAMKYFVEKWRGGKFVEKNGLIWWNVKDGWPIISDAVVDYYFGKKLAYYFIRNVQRDVCAMMLDEDSTGLYPLVIINDTREEASGKVTITDIESGKKVWSGKYRTEANGRTLLTHIGKKADKGMYLIEYSVGEDNFKNHYLYGEKPFDMRKVTGWLESIGIYNEAECLGSSPGR